MTDTTPDAAARPWMDAALPADTRAALLEAALTDDERFGLLHSRWAAGVLPGMAVPDGAVPGAGFVPPIDRLGVPGLYETDASLGVTNPRNCRPGDSATALPSGLALAASWNPDLAFASGAAIGDEAARKGFNVLLAGGLNLARDPRSGRNFEYLGEDPLLAGTLCGASIGGIQSNGIVATAKHFVLNDQETGRHVVNATIDEAALRESDLLAFEIAIERGAPGAIMTAYNKINGTYACEHAELLTGVLKGDWAFPGWVMSDWGATTSVGAALAGLDQQSGEELDHQVWFDAPLRRAVADGEVPAERIGDMSVASSARCSPPACSIGRCPGASRSTPPPMPRSRRTRPSRASSSSPMPACSRSAMQSAPSWWSVATAMSACRPAAARRR